MSLPGEVVVLAAGCALAGYLVGFGVGARHMARWAGQRYRQILREARQRQAAPRT